MYFYILVLIDTWLKSLSEKSKSLPDMNSSSAATLSSLKDLITQSWFKIVTDIFKMKTAVRGKEENIFYTEIYLEKMHITDQGAQQRPDRYVMRYYKP